MSDAMHDQTTVTQQLEGRLPSWGGARSDPMHGVSENHRPLRPRGWKTVAWRVHDKDHGCSSPAEELPGSVQVACIVWERPLRYERCHPAFDVGILAWDQHTYQRCTGGVGSRLVQRLRTNDVSSTPVPLLLVRPVFPPTASVRPMVENMPTFRPKADGMLAERVPAV